MIAIIADVHGNFPALEAVLKEIDTLGIKKIISLVDIAGYYCMINECIDHLRERNVINLMGNHDRYIVSQGQCPRSRSANDCLAFQDKIMTARNRQWLAASHSYLHCGRMSFVHGGWHDYEDEYLTTITSSYFQEYEGTLFFSGHTHAQIFVEFPDKRYCNPGSVGQPRDGKPEAAYVVMEHNKIHQIRIKYDIDRIAEAMRGSGFSEYYFENLYKGTQIGGKQTVVKVVDGIEKSGSIAI